MLRKVEDIAADFRAAIEIAVGDNQFIFLGFCLGDNLAGRRDDGRAPDQLAALLDARLGSYNFV